MPSSVSVFHQTELDIGKTAGARDADLVGPIERDRSRTRERELLLVFGDDFEVGIVLERDGLLRRHVIGHGLEQVPGVCLIGACAESAPPNPSINASAAMDRYAAGSRGFLGNDLHLRSPPCSVLISHPTSIGCGLVRRRAMPSACGRRRGPQAPQKLHPSALPWDCHTTSGGTGYLYLILRESEGFDKRL